MNENYNISEDKINEIRSSVDIVDVISSYIPLNGKGKNFFGVCPFHDDHSPSMSVSKDRQIYKCFSCGAGGNVFTFVKDYENISFLEAVKKMADKAGIFLDVKIKNEVNSKHKKYYEMYDLASKFYINNINANEGKEAIEYLNNRKISNEIIKEFKIGLSLKNNHLLTDLLLKKGYSEKEVLDSGLINKSDKLHDIYYNRIMFPLFDLNGKPVAFSGRIYNQVDTSKYVNTKETEVFKKGEILYNYHRAKNIARLKDEIIVTEGFMDVIRLYSIGIENAVATMGTAVTKEQCNLIKRMAKKVILMFDGDDAGKKAAYNASSMLNQMGVDALIVVLEDNLDPDEYIIKNGLEKMEYKLSHPLTMMDFKIDYLKKDKDIKTAEGKAKYIKDMIEELNSISDSIYKEATILKICEETGFDIDFVKSNLKEKEIKKEDIKEIKKEKKIEKGPIEAEKRLIFYMLNNEEAIKAYQKQVKFLTVDKYRLLAKEINYFYKEKEYISEADFITSIRDDIEMSETLKEITSLNEEEFNKEKLDGYIKRINNNHINSQIAYYNERLRKAKTNEEKNELLLNIIDAKKMLEEVEE